MPIIQILVILVILGLILYLVNTYIPMAPPIKTVVNVVAILLLCIWLLEISGLLSGGVYLGPHR